MKITSHEETRGQALIESTLTLTLFLTIIFALVDWGFVFFMHQTLADRAQAAARYGALYPTDLTAIKNYTVYNQPTGTGVAMFGLNTSNVSVTRTGQGTFADRISVTISGYSFTFISPVYAGKHQGNAITVSLPVEAN